MNCIPEKENLLLAYRDKFASIQQTHPEWSATDIRLQTAADLRPRFHLNRDAGQRENLGLSEYEVPEAAFTLTEDGSIVYTIYGQGLLELHERQLRLTPDRYSPEEHAISLLVEEHFRQGATSVVTSYGDRDLVMMQFDPITRQGTTKIIDVTKQQSTVQDVAKKRFAHFESLHLTDKIFFFTDKKLSLHHATEVIKPIMKQRVTTKSRFTGVHEMRHMQPPFYKRLLTYADDPYHQEEQIQLTQIQPFIHLPLISVTQDDKRDTSVRPWIIPEAPKTPKRDMQIFNETSKSPVKKMDGSISVQPIQQGDHHEDAKPVVSELPFTTQETVLFQRDTHATIEHASTDSVQQIDRHQEIILQAPSVLPITTYVTMVDKKIVPEYEEKCIAITLALHTQTHIEQPTQQHILVENTVMTKAHGVITEEKSVAYEVDQLMIADLQTDTDSIGKQIRHGEDVPVVTKLVWMELNDQEELVVVEEVEIAQDLTRTLQNLLHFLRKVVRTYCGVDSIRPRVIQKIASDKWSDEIGELEEYIAILKTQRMFHHLFATVH